jgi:hypothetical protein
MRASTGLQATVSRMTLDLQRQINSRSHAADYYGMAEREQQFQYAISGTVGFLPVETTIKILFDTVFLYEYGTRRDSQLLEPLVRFGFSQLSAPVGTVPYAHVQSWKQDDDFNYIGCTLVVGAHNPLVATVGTDPTTSLKFAATLHASFQGFGVPVETDDGSVGTSFGGAAPPPTPPAGGSPGDALIQSWIAKYGLPSYPAGPLGGGGSGVWETVADWNGGSLSDWSVPDAPGIGPLKVSGDGLLTTADHHAVLDGAWDSETLQYLNRSHNGITDILASSCGDKYCAIWDDAGSVGDGYKVRIQFKTEPSQDALNANNSVVVNMMDEKYGLAFFFGGSGIGWSVSLLEMGTTQRFISEADLIYSLDHEGQVVTPGFQGAPPYPTSCPFNQHEPVGGPGPQANGLNYQEYPMPPENSTDVTAIQNFLAWKSFVTGGYEAYGNLWVEVWRDGDNVHAAVYHGDPAGGAAPIYISNLRVADFPRYDSSVSGKFGWTMSEIPGTDSGMPGYDGKRGIVRATLFKKL